jgi:hypothetical protein
MAFCCIRQDAILRSFARSLRLATEVQALVLHFIGIVESLKTKLVEIKEGTFPMPTPSRNILIAQRNQLHTSGLDLLLTQFGAANGLPTEFMFAIASRETNCVNMLGDVQNGQAHGVGIVQIDIQHPIALQARDSGTWKTDPGPLINFGSTLLAADIIQVKHILPNLIDLSAILRIAASGYNCGIGTAIKAANQGDPDKFTTGHDYGQDVIARMLIFKDILAVNPSN